MKKISIVLIEDNRLLREGISAMIKKQPDMTIAATVGNGENILQLVEKANPDVVILDLGLRSRNSLEIVKLIKKAHPEIKIMVMDLIPLQEDVFEFVQAGVSGFTLKDVNTANFFKTLRLVYEGKKVLPPNLTDSLFSQIVQHAIQTAKPSAVKDAVRMTKRERQVIDLIADGFTNKEIASRLHLSTYTVKSHVHNILEKLSLHSRVQIANFANITDSFKDALDTTSLIE